jgi:hypothetical protein
VSTPGVADTAAVDRFLNAGGIEVRVARFGDSDFIVGSEILLDGLELVYRVDDGELVICHFAARGPSQGLASASGQLISLLERILEGVPGVHSVRGMIQSVLAEPELGRARARLADALLARGAAWVELDGVPWLRYRR